MKKFLATIALLVGLLGGIGYAQKAAIPSPETHQQFVQRVYSAVVLLYSQDESGGMHMHCTATAYRKTKDGVRFVTATHCVNGHTDEEQAETHFFVTADTVGQSKTFIPAKLVKAGDRNNGDDFSIFEITTTEDFPVLPLGDSDKLAAGDVVLDVASPLGLGKQYFQGYVSAPKIDRPALDAGLVKWTNVMLVQIGSGPGSSGSAVVSEEQHAIVGFLVGGFDADIGAIVVPVSTFKAFEAKVDAGTYKRHERWDAFKSFFGSEAQ